MPIYLDNNATTAASPAVIALVAELLGSAGNPASAHSAGKEARRHVERAREQVATLLHTSPEHIVFTSGGTEGNNTVLLAAPRLGHRQLVSSVVEHPSVLRALDLLAGVLAVELLPVSSAGVVDLVQLERQLAARMPTLVSLQWANSETGVLQPIAAVAELCKRHGALLHVDAAQAVGRIDVRPAELGIDFLSFAGHKLHGPQGTGALFVRRPSELPPLLVGGEQEGGLRAGTPNVAGIAGFGLACELRRANFEGIIAAMRRQRDRLESAILQRITRCHINGGAAERVANTSSLRFDGIDGQALVAQLDAQGVQVSQTSACASHRVEPSHVLRAMGLSEQEAYASLRVSLSEQTTDAEIDELVERTAAIVARLRQFAWL